MAWASNAKQGVYDGGVAVAASGTSGSLDQLSGTNMINFADSYMPLTLAIVEPLSTAVDVAYSSYSTVTTQQASLNEPNDTGVFRNFQTVIGSNHGDTINVVGTSTLNGLILGMGHNSVSITDVKAPTEASAADKAALTITALVSTGAALSDIALYNSDVIFEGSLNARYYIKVLSGSSFTGSLRGVDTIDTDKSSQTVTRVSYSEGEHLLNSNGGTTQVTMIPGPGDATIVVDENALASTTTEVLLDGSTLSQMVMRDSSGLHFSLAHSDGDAQVVNYRFGDATSDLAQNIGTAMSMFTPSNSKLRITVAALNDAINALWSGGANYTTATSSFTFDALYKQAALMHPSV